ncbi:hypothetical protein UFOVP225_55 [uncultured Caudovirales phage]|uniref:Uncharacterized protein n=1 Tax=uncultured Caudovirales phage TaxID=2100421 RepID=A0A6J5L538_9CAUD|nr:hypothetical protein UFOVP113_68 [uncultured Caudovirales phage]CAB5219323.1 hypothetical protein UFOVP225_55 [uncultured Caudovirales phage]
MEPNEDQFAELRAKQSPHDPSNLEACPDCGAASTMGKDIWGKQVRMHRADRGNGMYGYDIVDHTSNPDKKND